MTTTITCLVCGAAEDPGPDHTCPVCGADLPAAANPPATVAVETPTATTADVDGSAASEAPPTAPPVDPVAPAPPPPPAATWPAGSGPVPPPPPSGGGGRPRGGPSYDPSHPSGVPASLRTYGMLTHLSAFAGAIVALAFIGPMVMWLARRDEHPFLDHHGKEALNFNLSMLLYGVIGIVASVATVGFALVIVIPGAAILFVTWVVTTIIAAVKANNGLGYRYPLTIRFIGDDA